jgi:hypothetical protein
VAGKTKKLSDRVREIMDALIDGVQELLSLSPAPVRVRQPALPMKRPH